MLSTSMRKCSAVVCRAAPTWLSAEIVSIVFHSVLLVMGILFFDLCSFSDSIRSLSGRIAVTPPQSRRNPFWCSHARTVSNHGEMRVRVCIHRRSYRGRMAEGVPSPAPRCIAASRVISRLQHYGLVLANMKGNRRVRQDLTKGYRESGIARAYVKLNILL